MKVAFFSNYLSHHQSAFCEAMYKLCDGEFRFVATAQISQERMCMGWKNSQAEIYEIWAYENERAQREAIKWANECDAMIIGSAPEWYFVERVKKNRLTFRYHERPLKQGIKLKKLPRIIASMWLHHGRYLLKPVYMLSASAYTTRDYSMFGAYLGKSFKWGYFPEVKIQKVDELFLYKQARKVVSILWVARLIPLKHPELPIQIAERLNNEGYAFDMNIIGNGEMETELREMITQKHLDDCVHMLGSMSPEAVREHMEEAHIFLFTSDFNEGWGAVLNESMNSGCAVVASHAIGSVPFMIQDGKNGLIYKNGDTDDLYYKVKMLMEQPKLRERLGRNAYVTLAETWNADVAAERFLQLVEDLMQNGKSDRFSEGPCSPAKIIMNGWYRGAKNSYMADT